MITLIPVKFNVVVLTSKPLNLFSIIHSFLSTVIWSTSLPSSNCSATLSAYQLSKHDFIFILKTPFTVRPSVWKSAVQPAGINATLMHICNPVCSKHIKDGIFGILAKIYWEVQPLPSLCVIWYGKCVLAWHWFVTPAIKSWGGRQSPLVFTVVSCLSSSPLIATCWVPHVSIAWTQSKPSWWS